MKLRIVRSLTLYASLLTSCAPKVMILQSWKAHKKSGAKFFKDAKFYEQGGCVSMVAEAVKEGSTTTPSERIEKSEPTKPRNKNPMKKGKKA